MELMIISNGAAPAALALDELCGRVTASWRRWQRPACNCGRRFRAVILPIPLDLCDDASTARQSGF